MYLHSNINDYAEAALQRRLDAMALYEKARYRGAIYLKRYELECVLKYLLLAHLELAEFMDVRDRLKQEKNVERAASLSEWDMHDLVNLYGWLHHFGWNPSAGKLQQDLVIVQLRVGVDDRYNPADLDRETCKDIFHLMDQCIRELHPTYWKMLSSP